MADVDYTARWPRHPRPLPGAPPIDRSEHERSPRTPRSARRWRAARPPAPGPRAGPHRRIPRPEMRSRGGAGEAVAFPVACSLRSARGLRCGGARWPSAQPSRPVRPAAGSPAARSARAARRAHVMTPSKTVERRQLPPFAGGLHAGDERREPRRRDDWPAAISVAESASALSV